ncbi:hypothetical protein Tco_0869983 [Tanacetum coccineum]
MQQSYRGDTLHKRPLDDHQDDDKHEGEKAKLWGYRNHERRYEIGLKLVSEVAVRILKSKMVHIDKETSQELSTARNEVPREDKAEVPQEFMGMGESLGVSQLGNSTHIEKQWGHNYVPLFVRRVDNLRYTIKEVDLCMLELDDFEFLYLKQIDATE